GDFMVQVKTVPLPMARVTTAFEKNLFPGDGPAQVRNAAPFQAAGIMIVEDKDTFLKLEQGAVREGDEVKNYLAWQTCIKGTSKHGEALHAKNVAFTHLRVERLGPHLFFAGSPDGERWKYLPSATAAELGDILKIGLTAGHNTSDGFEATFSEYKLN